MMTSDMLIAYVQTGFGFTLILNQLLQHFRFVGFGVAWLSSVCAPASHDFFRSPELHINCEYII